MSLRARTIAIGLLAVLMAFLAWPSFYSDKTRMESEWIPNLGINLGLDLQGGIHWLLRIDTSTAIRQEMERAEDVLNEAAEERGIEHSGVDLLDTSELDITDNSVELTALAKEILTSLEPVQRDGRTLLVLTDDWHSGVIERGVLQAQEVLRSRIDKKGVREPVIAPQGGERILVQLPGDVDPESARDLLESTTFLEFKLVLAAAQNEDLLRDRYPEGFPEETEIDVSRNPDGSVSEALLVPKKAALTGAMLEDARLAFDRRNRPIITFTWNSEGTALFREFTGAHIGERLAAIIDGEVITAPTIQSRIGRNGQIEGGFTQQEAADLAVKLRSGALPIPLEIEEERQVGPALGADSIANGLRSIVIGGALVVLFMVIYYRTAGAFADLALILNLVIIIGLMGLAGATLTLPGIAGLVLTVGMAVDANVIIFERIREELRAGKSVRNAVQIGFKRSSLTIFDANITTMLAAVILLYFGRGPVQGFGVTLAVGIVSSVFCALAVTRVLVDFVVARNPEALKI